MCIKWGSIVAMPIGSFQICWQILAENTIFTYKNIFCSKKSCQNTSCAAKVSTAFGILLLAALELFPYPGLAELSLRLKKIIVIHSSVATYLLSHKQFFFVLSLY